jgi:hypothetical protein
MMFAAKGLEALGIASVMIGLVQGIQSGNMWMELYLSIGGVVLFIIGRMMEKRIGRNSPDSRNPLAPQ